MLCDLVRFGKILRNSERFGRIGRVGEILKDSLRCGDIWCYLMRFGQIL